MKQRNIIIAGAVFVLLLIYVLVTRTGNQGYSTVKLPSLPKIKAEEMTSIALVKPGEKLELLKQPDSTWRITSPFVFAADKNKVDAMLRMLESIRITNLVTAQAEREADYDLNTTTAVSLEIKGKASEVLQLTLGKANDGMTHTYVRLPGDRRIYQLLGDFTQQVKRPAKEWRSLMVYEFTSDKVKGVTISQKGKPELTFSKQQEVEENIVPEGKGTTPPALPSRMIWKAEPTGQVLNDPKVNQFLNAFTRLAANKIADEAVFTGEPLARILVLLYEDKKELEILEYQKSEDRYRVRRVGEDVIYEINKYQGDNLLKELKDLE